MNKLSSSSVNGKSPYELLFSKPPSLVPLKILGCLCYDPTLPKDDKFFERARPAVLMAYSTIQKGYLLLDLNSNKLYVNRYVTFREDFFIFARLEVRITPISYEKYANNSDNASSIISAKRGDSLAMNEEPSRDTSVFVLLVVITEFSIDQSSSLMPLLPNNEEHVSCPPRERPREPK